MSPFLPLKNGKMVCFSIRLAVCEDGETTVREDSYSLIDFKG